MDKPYATLVDGRSGEVKAVYEIVAFAHPVTRRWFDSRNPVDYDGKAALPLCDVCNRNAKRFDDWSAYCWVHWPVGEGV